MYSFSWKRRRQKKENEKQEVKGDELRKRDIPLFYSGGSSPSPFTLQSHHFHHGFLDRRVGPLGSPLPCALPPLIPSSAPAGIKVTILKSKKRRTNTRGRRELCLPQYTNSVVWLILKASNTDGGRGRARSARSKFESWLSLQPPASSFHFTRFLSIHESGELPGSYSVSSSIVQIPSCSIFMYFKVTAIDCTVSCWMVHCSGNLDIVTSSVIGFSHRGSPCLLPGMSWFAVGTSSKDRNKQQVQLRNIFCLEAESLTILVISIPGRRRSTWRKRRIAKVQYDGQPGTIELHWTKCHHPG